MTEDTTPRYAAETLRQFATQLLTGIGLAETRASIVAEILVDADILGHSTHGLALLPWYLEMAETGKMTLSGNADTLVDRGSCVTWDGRLLPGAWLLTQALDLAMSRAPQYGAVIVVIRRSGHVGALAPYMERAADKGFVALMASSTPSVAGVPPFGSTEKVFTPNPLGAGLPTRDHPVLLDISSSITTLNRARQLARDGRQFPGPWALDKEGNTSSDPDVVMNQGGSLLPVGGLDHGHKGYSLALLVEGLTQGLAGFGRADQPQHSGSSLYLQVIDPEIFGGRDAFTHQMQYLADRCRAAEPLPGGAPVRVPGDKAAAQRQKAAQRGVPIHPSIMRSIQPWATRLSAAAPAPLSSACGYS